MPAKSESGGHPLRAMSGMMLGCRLNRDTQYLYMRFQHRCLQDLLSAHAAFSHMDWEGRRSHQQLERLMRCVNDSMRLEAVALAYWWACIAAEAGDPQDPARACRRTRRWTGCWGRRRSRRWRTTSSSSTSCAALTRACACTRTRPCCCAGLRSRTSCQVISILSCGLYRPGLCCMMPASLLMLL